MNADLRFTNFNADTTPVVSGLVKTVGADKEPGADKDGDFYAAQVETSKEGLQKLAGLKIQPGMPVDVVVKTGERTFLSLLAKPIIDKFALAFK
jgi:protease secretion system membrane fusion protein